LVEALAGKYLQVADVLENRGEDALGLPHLPT